MVQNLINVDRCSSGLFVEFGARDGWRESNTYFFEKSLGWRGLLLEADPRQVMQLHANRKASVIVEGAVCPSGSPSNITILSSHIGGFSGFASTFEKSRMRTVTKRFTVPCHSLETLLREHHMHRVDYMTIDTEGSEALIIDDFPWRQFDVRVVQVEQLNDSRFHSQAGKQEQITRRLVAEGYRLAHVIVVRRGHTEDLIFVKNSSSAAAADANAGSEAAALKNDARGRHTAWQPPEDGVPPLQVDNWSLTTSPREASAEGLHFLVSIGTVPGARSERWVEQTIHSLLQQTRKPDRILVVAPKLFVRFPNQTVNLASVLSKINGVGMARVMTRYCEADFGPGSKLLCALPTLRELAAGAHRRWALVLADDDKKYKPWALDGLERMMAWLPLNRHAYSYETWNIWIRSKGVVIALSGQKVLPGAAAPLLRLGQGADMLAVPATALLSSADSLQRSGPHDFFACVDAIDARIRYHDDFWIAVFLQSTANLTMASVPFTTAKRGFKHCWTKVAGASTENSLLHIDKSKWSVGENRTKLTHAGINRACVSNLARMISECGVRCQRVTRGR